MFLDNITKIDIVNYDDTGSDVSRRFDYQLACAFMTLITVCDRTEDFAVILERVDDFLIVEDLGTEDECVSFVQVKTDKNGPFTLNCVVKNEWIKKQAQNYLNFLDTNVRNIFLTNFGIKFSKALISDTTLTKITDLPKSEDKQKLITQINDVLLGKGSIEDFYIIKGILTIDGFETQLKGYLHNYAIGHNCGNISSELLETVYKEIWHDLHKKQRYVLNDSEKKDYQEIVDKKGIEYSSIKNIIGIAKSIEIPAKAEISSFFFTNQFCIDGYETFLLFLDDYNDFRVQSHNAMDLLEECRNLRIDNSIELNKCADAYAYSCEIMKLLDDNFIISSSEFYKRFRTCISAMLTYKAYKD